MTMAKILGIVFGLLFILIAEPFIIFYCIISSRCDDEKYKTKENEKENKNV